MLYGVDIHGTYQRGINFPLLVKQGYSFAAVKATQGSTEFHASYTQQFLDWIPKIKAAGLIPGAYHWLTNADPVAQCANFLRRLNQVGGAEGLLIQLDCEDNATLPVLQGWVKEWNRRTNNHPFLIYSGAWWWKPRGWNGAQFTPYLWDSHYISVDSDTIADDPAALAAKVPASWWKPTYGNWPKVSVLQFTSKGDAGGLGNNVDLNSYPGSRADMLALTTTNPNTITEEDEMSAEDSNILRALADGMPTANGRTFTPTQWHIQNTKAFDALAKKVDALAEKVDAESGLSDDQLRKLIDAVVLGLKVPVSQVDREAMIDAAQEAMRRGTGAA